MVEEKEIDHWRILSINYLYRGELYKKDDTFKGHGRKFIKVGSNDSLWVQPGISLYKAGIEVVRHCYPVFKKK